MSIDELLIVIVIHTTTITSHTRQAKHTTPHIIYLPRLRLSNLLSSCIGLIILLKILRLKKGLFLTLSLSSSVTGKK